jgi:hypothetical protein
VRRGLEAAAGRHRDMTVVDSTGRLDLAKLDVIPGSAIAIDATPEFFVTGTRLHRSAAHFTVSDVADA